MKSFTYDAAGRTTAVTVGNDTTTLAYDYESRITQITYPDQSTNTFSNNGLDTRVSKVDSTGTRTYLRDGPYVTDPVLSDGAATYTPAISERRSSATTFYHTGIKNGDSQTNTSESLTASIQYDAFGNVASSSGTWSGPFAYGGPYGYQSDPDSGLKLLGHRYYDPSTGRFLTRDPVKDGRNWYGYCGNNPANQVDPKGLWLLTSSLLLLDDGVSPPIAPPGVGWRDHVREAERRRKRRGILPPGSPDPFMSDGLQLMWQLYEDAHWFKDHVDSAGPWDFKLIDPAYEEFGNFHYGVVGTALGFDEELLLIEAGNAQKRHNPGKVYSDSGPPFYGDDPSDVYWIRRGIRYYEEIAR